MLSGLWRCTRAYENRLIYSRLHPPTVQDSALHEYILDMRICYAKHIWICIRICICSGSHLYMFICVYIGTWPYLYTSQMGVCTYFFVSVHVSVLAHVHLFVYALVCVYACVSGCACVVCLLSFSSVCTYLCVYMRTHEGSTGRRPSPSHLMKTVAVSSRVVIWKRTLRPALLR